MRSVATSIGVSAAYMSDIENDNRKPAEGVLLKIAGLLGLDADQLQCDAGRIGRNAERYLKKHPTAVKIVRKLVSYNFTEEELKRLLEKVEQI